MRVPRCPEAVTGKDSPRQHGDIALSLIDRNGWLNVPTAVQGAVLQMPSRMDRGFRGTLGVGEFGRQRSAIHHGGAISGVDHVRQIGQGLQKIDSMACRTIGVNQP
jgi:hypothetical protein